MNRTARQFIVLAVFSGLFVLRVDAGEGIPSTPPFSPVALAFNEGKKFLAIAEQTGSTIAILNEDANLIHRFPVSGQPSAVGTYNDKILVTIKREFGGYLVEMNVENGTNLREVRLGKGAKDLAIDQRMNVAYVCNFFSNDISAVDLSSFKEIKRIEVPRMPSACVLSPNGERLFVANFLPDGRSDLPVVASRVTVIDTSTFEILKHIQLENGSNALKGIAISSDGLNIIVTHTLARYQVPTTQLERGWVNTNALSLIDTGSLQLRATVLLDDPDLGAAGPWGVDMSPDGKYIYIAHAGTNEISIIDYNGMLDKIDHHSSRKNINYDLGFLNGLRRRIPLEGIGCRALLANGNKLFVGEYFSDSLSVLEIESIESVNLKNIKLNPNLVVTRERMGEILFNDATICYQNWQSCSSCHPDGRMDGLNWDLLNDGMGNPKNTKSILYSHFTPPMNSTGSRINAESSVRAGFKYIHFSPISEENAQAVDAYLKSLKPEPSPYLIDGVLSKAAMKGKRLFNDKAKCLRCHDGAYMTDMAQYDMHNAGPKDKRSTWDTPTLIENWRSSPYLHDGRAATLYDVVKQENHGEADDLLSDEELLLLVEYMKTL